MAEDKRISELSPIPTVTPGALFPVVDEITGETMSARFDQMATTVDLDDYALKTYVDAQDIATLDDAKDYADLQDVTNLNAAKAYADGLVVGLWDDRGNFNASVNAYPSSGGSGTAGAIKKGDIWTVSVAGILPSSQSVEVGDTVRALVDTPGNTQANWSIQQNNIGYTAENSANKTNVIAGNEASTTLYASVKGFVDYLVGMTWLTSTIFGTWIVGNSEKSTPVDADVFLQSDSADSNKSKKVTWANIKATLLIYFNTLYVDLSSAQTISGQKTFSRNTGNSQTGTGTGTVISNLDCQNFIRLGRTYLNVAGSSVTLGTNSGHNNLSNTSIVGANSGNWSMSGQYISIFGDSNAASKTSGIVITAIGSEAVNQITSGNYITALGWGSAYNVTTATNCVYLGHGAGRGLGNQSNRLAIDAETFGKSFPFIYGEFDNSILAFNINRLGIGTKTPNASSQIDLASTTLGLGLNLVANASKPTGRKGNFLMNDTNSVLEFTTGTGANWQELAVYKFDELLQITDCNATFSTANTGVYFPFVPKCDMNVTKIFYNLQSAGTDTVRVAIYSDSSNTPTTLLVQSSEATTGATPLGQRSITIASTRLLAQTRYWIAIKNDNGASSFLSKNNVYSNNITREGFTSGVFVGSPSPSSAVNAVWVGIGI